MYVTVSCLFLISFLINFTALATVQGGYRDVGGGFGHCGTKNLLHWTLEAHVHKTTYWTSY